MAFKMLRREDHEANSEKIARLFRECSGIGAGVSPIDADTTVGGNQAFDFIGTGATAPTVSGVAL
jgi:hypothetical protein